MNTDKASLSTAIRIACFIALFACDARGAEDPPYRASGLRRLTPEELAAYHERMFVFEPLAPPPAPLPDRVINTEHLPAVRSQGSLGTCSAFAAGYYYKTYQEARERGWSHPDPATHPERVASPMWTFNLCRQWGQRIDGISHYDAMDLFCTFGCASWAEMPYADTHDIHAVPEDPAVLRRAMEWRAARMGRIRGLNTLNGISFLKRHLASGDLAVGSIGYAGGVGDNFFSYPSEAGANGINNGVYFRPDGANPYNEGHALAIVGYDDNLPYVDDRTGTTRRGAFLAVNSWGTGWGVVEPSVGTDGFVWIAYQHFLDGGTGPEAVIMQDRTAYQPTTIAAIGVDAPSADSINNNPFTLYTERMSKRPFYWINGSFSGTREFLLDISDWLGPPVMSVGLRTFRADYFSAPATITSFRLEDGTGQVLATSEDTPLMTVLGEFRYLKFKAMKPETAGVEGMNLRSGSAAFGDANGDGWPDLVIAGARIVEGGGPHAVDAVGLWINQGDGTFTEAAGTGLPVAEITELAWSDVNNDGSPDLWLSGGTLGTRLYRNSGAATFTDVGLRLPAASGGGLLAPADYNRDGRPDLAVANQDAVYVCRQESDGSFATINIEPAGVKYHGYLGAGGMLAWGDPNGDGFPDLAVCGIGEDTVSRVYRNLGDEGFVVTDPGIPDQENGMLAFSDIDGDGWDDLSISGVTPRRTLLLRNQGDGTFAAITPATPFPGAYFGRMQWVDMNHDGRRDLLMTGRKYQLVPGGGGSVWDVDIEAWPNLCEVYANLGADNFEAADLELPRVTGYRQPTPMAVADVTGDGSPDFYTAGSRTGEHETNLQHIVSQLIRNRSAEFPGLGGTNAPPTAPGVLFATPGAGGSVRFVWGGATDDVCQESGLRYILRIGTTSGGGDICSGAIHPADFGNLVRSGVTYRNLPAGTLYCSVRTVDPGLAVSPWSAIRSVTVVPYAPMVHVHPDAKPDYAGTTTPADAYTVSPGSQITITANPAPLFEFDHWDGSVPSNTTANPLVMNADTHVHARACFVPREPVSPLPGGKGVLYVYSDVPAADARITPPVGSYMDTIGTVVSISAEPRPGLAFVRWAFSTGAQVADPNAKQTTVVLGEQTAVRAKFTIYPGGVSDGVTYTLASDPPDAYWNLEGDLGTRTVERGWSISLHARARPGYRFSHWSGPVVSPLASHTDVAPTNDVTVTAHFASERLSVGAGHTTLRRNDETFWVWGTGSAGQSGIAWMRSGGGLPPLATWHKVNKVAAGRAFNVGADHWSLHVWGEPWTASEPADDAWAVDPLEIQVMSPTTENYIRQVAAGGEALLVLDEEGQVWGSGRNEDRPLGDSVPIFTTNIVAIRRCDGSTISDITFVAIGNAHALAVDDVGRVWGWGRNGNGQVSSAHPPVIEKAVPLTGLPPCLAVAASRDVVAGRSYAVAMDGSVWHWGNTNPPAVVAGVTGVVSLAAGGQHALALDAAGRVFAWGDNSFGQLGVGSFDASGTPQPVSGLPTIVEVAAGPFHSAALAADGRVFAWGGNTDGAVTGIPGVDIPAPVEIADMNATDRYVFVTVEAVPPSGGSTVPPAKTYYGRVGGILPLTPLPDESRYTFSHWEGSVADPYMSNTTASITGQMTVRAHFALLTNVPARLTMAVSPASSGTTIPAEGEYELTAGSVVTLRADHAARHRFVSWTGSVDDAFSRDTQITLTQDETVTANFERMPFLAVPMVSGLLNEPLILYRSGIVQSTRVWQSPVKDDYFVTPVLGPVGGTTYLQDIMKIEQCYHNLALSADGTMFAWGPNGQGQCGIGAYSATLDRPTPVAGPGDEPRLHSVVHMAASAKLSLALDASGNVYQWGELIGPRPGTWTNRPMALWDGGDIPVTNAVSIDSRERVAAVVFRDGTVKVWDSSTTVTTVVGLANVQAAAVGRDFFLALLADGTVRGWGENSSGQLGNGTGVDSPTPVTVTGLSNIVAIAAGRYHGMALDAAGRVYTWGANGNGQLGDGTKDYKYSPVWVSALTNVFAIDAGEQSSYAIDETGHLFAWGAIRHTDPYYATTTPYAQPVGTGATDARLVRLDLTAEPASYGAVFPATGVTWYNAGDEVELRALPATGFVFVAWSDGGTAPVRSVTLNDDFALTAKFAIRPPTLRLEDVEASPGTTALIPILVEDGTIPYGGLNAGLRLPPGVSLSWFDRGADLPDGYTLDVRSRTAADGAALVTLAAFGTEGATNRQEAEWAVLRAYPGDRAFGGTFPLEWMNAQWWSIGSPAALTDTNGVLSLAPRLVSASMTIHRPCQVRAALRVASTPAGTDRMNDAVFAAYPGQMQYRDNQSYVVEVWLRYSGSNEVGVANARVDLQADGEPLTILALGHGALFNQNPSGTINGQSVEALGGGISGSTGEGCRGWVRLGWVTVPAPRAVGPSAWSLTFDESLPQLGDGSTLEETDALVLSSPVIVDTFSALQVAAGGTPHWWLEAHGLVMPGGNYDLAERLDLDGDGQTALEEFLGGSNPNDGDSLFGLQDITPDAAGMVLHWNGVAGHAYRVLAADSLLISNWTTIHGPLNCPANQPMSQTVRPTAARWEYYRVTSGMSD